MNQIRGRAHRARRELRRAEAAFAAWTRSYVGEDYRERLDRWVEVLAHARHHERRATACLIRWNRKRDEA